MREEEIKINKERKKERKKERTEVKTYSVPFNLEEIKENIKIITNNSAKHSKEQIID